MRNILCENHFEHVSKANFDVNYNRFKRTNQPAGIAKLNLLINRIK